MNDQDMQEIQMLDYKAKQLQKVLETVDSQLFEIQKTIDSLKEFDVLKGNEEILFPIANGIFAKAKLSEDKILKINIGSEVVVEKTPKQTIEMMQKQTEEIENYKKELTNEFQKVIMQMQNLQE